MSNRLRKMLNVDRQLSSWGPRFEGMAEAVANRPLEEVCALQWRACVEAADHALAALPAERVHRIYYEEVAQRPREQLARLGAFLGVEVPEAVAAASAGRVSPRNIGKGREELDGGMLERVMPMMEPILERHGYQAFARGSTAPAMRDGRSKDESGIDKGQGDSLRQPGDA